MLLFSNWPWFSDLLSKPTLASWKSIHCHFPLSGGTLILTGEVHWPFLWPSLSRGLFSLSGFSCPFLAACPPVLQTNAHRGAWVTNFIAHSWSLIYVHAVFLLSSQLLQSDARLGVREGSKQGQKRRSAMSHGSESSRRKARAAGSWDSCCLGKKWPLNLTLLNWESTLARVPPPHFASLHCSSGGWAVPLSQWSSWVS